MARFAFISLGILLSGPVMAQQGLLGLYVGFGAGNFQFDEEQRGLRSSLAALGDALPVDGLRIPGIDDSAIAWKAFSGWQFTDNLGVEVSYGQTSNLETVYSSSVGDVTVSARIGTDVKMGTARAMGFLPVKWVSLFGGIGYYQADSSSDEDIDLMISGIAAAGDAVTLGGSPSSERGPTVIFGVQWSLPSLIVRADYEWFDMEAADAGKLGLGVSLRF